MVRSSHLVRAIVTLLAVWASVLLIQYAWLSRGAHWEPPHTDSSPQEFSATI